MEKKVPNVLSVMTFLQNINPNGKERISYALFFLINYFEQYFIILLTNFL
jgi:hypothetical protein